MNVYGHTVGVLENLQTAHWELICPGQDAKQ